MKRTLVILLLISLSLGQETETTNLGKIHHGSKIALKLSDLISEKDPKKMEKMFFDITSKSKEAVIINQEQARKKFYLPSLCHVENLINLNVKKNYFLYACTSDSKTTKSYTVEVYKVKNWEKMIWQGLRSGLSHSGEFNKGKNIFLIHKNKEYLLTDPFTIDKKKIHSLKSHLYSLYDDKGEISGSLVQRKQKEKKGEKEILQDVEFDFGGKEGEHRYRKVLVGDEYILTKAHEYDELNFLGFFRRVKDVENNAEIPPNSALYYIDGDFVMDGKGNEAKFEMTEVDLNENEELKKLIKIKNINDMEVFRVEGRYIAFFAFLEDGKNLPNSRFFECEIDLSSKTLGIKNCREQKFETEGVTEFNIFESTEIDYELEIKINDQEIDYRLSMLCLNGFTDQRKSHFYVFEYKENKTSKEKTDPKLTQNYKFLENLGIGSKLESGLLHLDTGSNKAQPSYHKIVKYKPGDLRNIEAVFHINATSVYFDKDSNSHYAFNGDLMLRYRKYENLFLEIDSRTAPESDLDKEVEYILSSKQTFESESVKKKIKISFDKKNRNLKNEVGREIKIRQLKGYFTRLPFSDSMITGYYDSNDFEKCEELKEDKLCYNLGNIKNELQTYINGEEKITTSKQIFHFKNKILYFPETKKEDEIKVFQCKVYDMRHTYYDCKDEKKIKISLNKKISHLNNGTFWLNNPSKLLLFGTTYSETDEKAQDYGFLSLISLKEISSQDLLYDHEEYGNIESVQIREGNKKIYIAFKTKKIDEKNLKSRLHVWTLDLSKENPLSEIQKTELTGYDCLDSFSLTYRKDLILTFLNFCENGENGNIARVTITEDGKLNKPKEIETLGHYFKKGFISKNSICGYEDKILMITDQVLYRFNINTKIPTREKLEIFNGGETQMWCLKDGKIELLNYSNRMVFDSRDSFIEIFKSFSSFKYRDNKVENSWEDGEFYYLKARSYRRYKFPKTKMDYYYMEGGAIENPEIEFFEGYKEKKKNIEKIKYKVESLKERPETLEFEVNKGFDLKSVEEVEIHKAFKIIHYPVFQYKVVDLKSGKELTEAGNGVLKIENVDQKIEDLDLKLETANMIRISEGVLLAIGFDNKIYLSKYSKKFEKILDFDFDVISLDACIDTENDADLVIGLIGKKIGENFKMILKVDTTKKEIKNQFKLNLEEEASKIKIKKISEKIFYFTSFEDKIKIFSLKNFNEIKKIYTTEKGKKINLIIFN